MRRKQVGPELKLFELDTLKYITEDNIKDSIYYVGIYPNRMSPADITFARKSGMLYSIDNKLFLSDIAIHYVLGAITYREYAFLILSKQWIKTTDIGKKPAVYNEPLLPCVLENILIRGRISKSSFNQVMDEILISKYAPIILSNTDSLRYIHALLIASELVDGTDFIINPLATGVVHDLIHKSKKIAPPTSETEFELYWCTMAHGVFDIITNENKDIYYSFYPNLIKSSLSHEKNS